MRLELHFPSFSRALATAALMMGAATAASAQGTITGRITAQGTNAPLGEARIIVIGSNAAATSSQDGKFTVNGVRAGSVELQVLRIGFAPLKKSVTVTAGNTTS